MLGLFGLDTDKNFTLETVKVECKIYNLMVNGTADFVYRNATGLNTDALFMFTFDPDWTFYHFQSVIGGKTVVGMCKDLDEAKKLHKAATDSGQREIVVEGNQDITDVFKFPLGNIANGSEVKISLKFVTELKMSVDASDDENVDRFNFTLPIIARPRCTGAGGAPDDQFFYVHNQFEYKFLASCQGTKEIKNIFSKNHQMKINYSNAKKTQAQVELQSKFDGNQEFVLVIDYVKLNNLSLLYTFGSNQNEMAEFFKSDLAVIDFVPLFESKRMEIVFMVDRSDSMAGSDMQQAKKCILYFLKNLPTNCMFQIYGFGTYFDKAFMQPESYSDETIKIGMEYQKKIAADFDLTDFMLPFKHLFNCPLLEDYERVVFLLTDGDVSNRDEVVELIKANNASTRLYCIGLGPGTSGAFLRKMATAGNGESMVLKTSQTLPATFVELFDRTVKQNPFIVQKIDWQCPNSVTISNIPEKSDPVQSGGFLRLFCTVKGLKKGDKISGTLTAIYNGKSTVFTVTLDSTEGLADGDYTAHRLLAKHLIGKKIPEVENGNADSKKSLIKLSVDSNIKTKLTSIVTVDKMAPGKGLTVPEIMDPLVYYRPVYKMENYTKKADKNVRGQGDSTSRLPRQLWIRSEVKETTHGSIMIFIADKQNSNGSWDLDPQLIWRIGLDTQTVDENKPEFISNEIWITLVVFEFLATKLRALEKEWKLIGKKAKEHVCISIKESSTLEKIQSSGLYENGCDVIGFIQYITNMALSVLKEVATPLSEITAKEIEGASSIEMAERKKYEIVFVIDRSGSMQGVKVESAKQCLYIFLKSLPDNSRIQIYGFGTRFDKAFPEYLPYNDDSVHLGLAYQSKIDASFGGTELLNPLKDIFSAPLVDEYTRLLFILTDGQISNETPTIDLVRQNNKLNKVYSVGIGKDVSKSLIDRLAEAGLGQARFVKETSIFSAIVIELLNEALNSD